jgi:hypothetical protein
MMPEGDEADIVYYDVRGINDLLVSINYERGMTLYSSFHIRLDSTS